MDRPRHRRVRQAEKIAGILRVAAQTPKGPGEALTQAIVELKSSNPRFGCPRIARIISHTFAVDIDQNVTRNPLNTPAHGRV
jgi:hypothetical protein